MSSIQQLQDKHRKELEAMSQLLKDKDREIMNQIKTVQQLKTKVNFQRKKPKNHGSTSTLGDLNASTQYIVNPNKATDRETTVDASNANPYEQTPRTKSQISDYEQRLAALERENAMLKQASEASTEINKQKKLLEELDQAKAKINDLEKKNIQIAKQGNQDIDRISAQLQDQDIDSNKSLHLDVKSPQNSAIKKKIQIRMASKQQQRAVSQNISQTNDSTVNAEVVHLRQALQDKERQAQIYEMKLRNLYQAQANVLMDQQFFDVGKLLTIDGQNRQSEKFNNLPFSSPVSPNQANRTYANSQLQTTKPLRTSNGNGNVNNAQFNATMTTDSYLPNPHGRRDSRSSNMSPLDTNVKIKKNVPGRTTNLTPSAKKKKFSQFRYVQNNPEDRSSISTTLQQDGTDIRQIQQSQGQLSNAIIHVANNPHNINDGSRTDSALQVNQSRNPIQISQANGNSKKIQQHGTSFTADKANDSQTLDESEQKTLIKKVTAKLEVLEQNQHLKQADQSPQQSNKVTNEQNAEIKLFKGEQNDQGSDNDGKSLPTTKTNSSHHSTQNKDSPNGAQNQDNFKTPSQKSGSQGSVKSKKIVKLSKDQIIQKPETQTPSDVSSTTPQIQESSMSPERKAPKKKLITTGRAASNKDFEIQPKVNLLKNSQEKEQDPEIEVQNTVKFSLQDTLNNAPNDSYVMEAQMDAILLEQQQKSVEMKYLEKTPSNNSKTSSQKTSGSKNSASRQKSNYLTIPNKSMVEVVEEAANENEDESPLLKQKDEDKKREPKKIAANSEVRQNTETESSDEQEEGNVSRKVSEQLSILSSFKQKPVQKKIAGKRFSIFRKQEEP